MGAARTPFHIRRAGRFFSAIVREKIFEAISCPGDAVFRNKTVKKKAETVNFETYGQPVNCFFPGVVLYLITNIGI